MKYLIPSLVALLVALTCWSAVSTTESTLVTHAQTINDLKYVLGPNFNFFVFGYWRYLSLSCDYLSAKMFKDIQNGILEKYCNYLNKCPVLYLTQSCLVQISVYAVNLTCCSQAEATTTKMPPLHVTEDVKTVTDEFNLLNQQLCNYGRVLPTAKIFGGTEAKKGEFPWMGMLLKDDQFHCGCVIIDRTHVLTAAHCFDTHENFSTYDVIGGKHHYAITDATEQKVRVKSFIQHHGFDIVTLRHDIAMLVLVQPFVFNDNLYPACLPSPNDTLPPLCTIAGWGQTEAPIPPSVLMKTELQAYNRSQCFAEFNNTAYHLWTYLSENAICAANGHSGNKDSCKGDSGGPLMCIKRTQSSAAWFVFGIVSNGNGCAQAGEVGIYMSVQSYLSWINITVMSTSMSRHN